MENVEKLGVSKEVFEDALVLYSKEDGDKAKEIEEMFGRLGGCNKPKDKTLSKKKISKYLALKQQI